LNHCVEPWRRAPAALLVAVAAAGGACSEQSSRRGASEDAGGAAGGSSAGAAGDSTAGAGGAPVGVPPELLSEAGLYADLSSGEELAPGVIEYRPRFELWSDGAEKRRFLFLPPGDRIDSSDMDYWVFPVGTRAFKEFTRDGVRVETRMLEKTADGQWLMLAFAWNSEGTDAFAAPRGENDAGGTPHDIPSRVMCGECHENMPDRLLGIGAVQLAHSLGGLTLDTLIADGRLTHPPPSPIELPGDTVAQEALGYLHANCGNCHNRRSGDFPMVHLELHLEVLGLSSIEETTTYRTTVDVPFEGVPPSPDIPELRIVPGDPEGSAVYQRMNVREPLVQMPPLGTEEPDATGLAAVASFITALDR
jgi:hypothetical protein